MVFCLTPEHTCITHESTHVHAPRRELGRRPSQQEEKVSLYVRKHSKKEEGEKEEDKNKARRFMDKMSKKSVDADFLNTIEEEKEKKPFQNKKFPFNR